MSSQQNKILCINSQSLFRKGKWNGIQRNDLAYYYDLLLKESEFRVRAELETDSDYKQIIPQVILKFQGKFFLHRQQDAGEKRLNSFCPLALGGHVEQFDLEGKEDILQTALLREVDEEAELQANIIAKELVGLIYLEDENPVNSVHVGLLYVFEIDSDKVRMHEKGLETVGWVDAQYLKDHLKELNYWSRAFVTTCL